MLDFPVFYRNFVHILILIYLDDSSFVRRIIRSVSAHYTKTADRRFSARQPNVSRGTIRVLSSEEYQQNIYIAGGDAWNTACLRNRIRVDLRELLPCFGR